MGITGLLTDAILTKMDPADRAKLGPAGVTAAESAARDRVRSERKDHSDFINYCNLRAITWNHCDPTRKSTARTGWPDFDLSFPVRRRLLVEFKVRPNKLTPEQEERRIELERDGWPYVIVYSLHEAIEAVQRHLLT
jgi:hypothetical protein